MAQQEEVTRYYSREVERLGVDIRLGQEVTADFVEDLKPDAIVVATGSRPKIPVIKGVVKPDGSLASNVVTVLDVLSDAKPVGNRVVVIGGNHFGIQAAFYLLDLGKEVTIVETLPTLNQDLDGALAWDGFLIPKIENSEITVIVGSYVKEITPKGVFCEEAGVTPNCLDVGPLVNTDAESIIECDTVVVGTGREPLNYLIRELENSARDIYAIGDCVKPRWTYSATGEGARLGISL